MKDLSPNGNGSLKGPALNGNPMWIVVTSLVAQITTFVLVSSSIADTAKLRGFGAIVAVFLVVCFFLHYRNSRHEKPVEPPEDAAADVDRQLLALEDANQFFAGSLNASDSFRLVASRVRELTPFRTITLYVIDNERYRFHAVESEGADAEIRRGRWSELGEGAIARSYFSQVVEIDHPTASLRPVAAIPLKKDYEVFGVLHMDFEMNFRIDEIDLDLLDAIGTRAAPLLLSSFSYEQSHVNALTDATTSLPNERAFHLVLENQVAESQRNRNVRPLTILTLDVRSFEEMNSRFGHAACDRLLTFVAQIIKDNLRQMDFFARATGDEFLIVLPTASKEVSHEVIARIHTGFFGRKLKISDSEAVEVELNIGWAAFGTDGETPETLLRVARERKEQSKTGAPNKVVWFPTEFAS